MMGDWQKRGRSRCCSFESPIAHHESTTTKKPEVANHFGPCSLPHVGCRAIVKESLGQMHAALQNDTRRFKKQPSGQRHRSGRASRDRVQAEGHELVVTLDGKEVAKVDTAVPQVAAFVTDVDKIDVIATSQYIFKWIKQVI